MKRTCKCESVCEDNSEFCRYFDYSNPKTIVEGECMNCCGSGCERCEDTGRSFFAGVLWKPDASWRQIVV